MNSRLVTPQTNQASVNQVSALQALEKVLQRLEEIAADAAVALQHPVCVSGCGACCVNNYVLDLEVVNILSNAINLYSAEKWKQINDLALSWCVEPRSEFEYSKVQLSTVMIPGQKERIQAQVVQLGSQVCPFLDENKACMIYEVRPIACRAYGLLTPPFYGCKRPLSSIETQERRASLYLTPYHAEIAMCLAELSTFMNKVQMPDRDFGFLPFLMARRTRSVELQKAIGEEKVPSAIRSMGTNLLPWQFMYPVETRPDRNHPLLADIRQQVKQ